jgi:hypothetical protein
VENRAKLAIMSILLIMSLMPIAMFFAFENYSKFYISALLNGSAGINIDLQKGWLVIYSKTLTLAPLRINFLEVILLLASIGVFCASLVFVAKTLYNTAIKHKPL